MTQRLQGVAASPGIVIGQARHVQRTRTEVVFQDIIGPGQVVNQLHRLDLALEEVEADLTAIKARVEKELPSHVYLIDAHLKILADPLFQREARRLIEGDMINAEWAVVEAVRRIGERFEAIDDPYIRSRLEDVEAVADRVLRVLAGQEDEDLGAIKEPGIFIAHDLSPTDTTQIRLDRVMGFVTEAGSRTSHTAIVAQSVQLPAVVGLERAMESIPSGSVIIVDGTSGQVIVDPDEETLFEFEERKARYERFVVDIRRKAHLPAETSDGCRLKVLANIELPKEAVTALESGAEGIGLVRTEFLYLNRADLPGEEELYEALASVVDIMNGRPVTIRTLDLGGDKFAHQLDLVPEMNPAMGVRAVRLCLRRPDIFRTQLRAILRASAHGPVRVMFPMISGIREMVQCRAILEACQAELKREGQEFDPDLKVGCMIEVPSAVIIVDLLARHADFFSIGTNDLIQYSLAIDRVNEYVAHMYQPFHPAVLRMIKSTIQAADEAGIPVSMCGEMAGEPGAVPMLIGLGLKELSVNPVSVPRVKQITRLVAARESRELADTALTYETEAQVSSYVTDKLAQIAPEAFGKGVVMHF